MKVDIFNKIGGYAKVAGMSLKKHSPEILIVTGVIGTVTAAVWACKKTMKLPDILEEHDGMRFQMEEQHEANKDNPNYNANKETAKLYLYTGLRITKLYAPAVTLGVVSLGCIIASNDILRKRNAALAAAYAAVDKSFKEYRERVIKRFGDEVDYQLKNGIEKQEIEETITDEKGKEKKVKKTVDVVDPNASGSPYIKYFTRKNPYWENNEDYVMMFLRSRESIMNDKLHAENQVVLNQVYESLGFEKTKAGMIAGWIDDPLHPSSDGYIQFDIRKVYIHDENGELEDAYAIDFNVDGNIYDRIL